MREYKQLCYEERVKIAQLLQSETPKSQIAKQLGRHPATISREILRNKTLQGSYWPDSAQRSYIKKRQKVRFLDTDKALRAFVLEKLQCHSWAPEQIAGHLKHKQCELRSVSHETIYTWIYAASQKKEKLYKYLTRSKAKRGLRKSKRSGVFKIPNRTSIHERPLCIKENTSVGHWEGDLMSCIKGSQHILVLRERTTMFTLSQRLVNKTKGITTEAIISLLKGVPLESRRSITFDNGGEFAGHLDVKKAFPGLQTYFCDPYASWQKGGVENTNGRLRKDFPRSFDIKAMSQEDFDESIQNYNTTPRKKLLWLTPLEAFQEKINCVALHT